MKGQQLPLAVQLRDTASYASFFAGPNGEALQALSHSGDSLLLYGPPASGKTHLLQACARSSGAAYLPLIELAEHGADALDGYGSVDDLCLDDIDAVCGGRDWCITLLRLLDGLRARQARVVIAAAAPPERLAMALPDLRTRLSACAVFGLKPLDDLERAQLLRERARARGLELPEDCSRWLLTRLARDTGTLLQALEKLDQASLAERRRLTLPFVQQVTQPLAPGSAAAQTTPTR